MTEDLSTPNGATGETPQIAMRIVQRTDVGRVRSENQDFAITTTPEESGYGFLMVVADGMGGHRGGATASQMAGEIVKSEFLAAAAENASIAQNLRVALETANQRIFAESQANQDLRGMGTTCSALLIRNDEAWIAHVGDSRIYLVRGGQIQVLTEDHSLVASMVREGLITPEEAEVHPRRNVLQRSMGVAELVEVDVYEPLRVLSGDRFILCSDGLHGLVKEAELQQVASENEIEQAADRFIELALERGAHDNVTVIVAEAVGDGSAVAPPAEPAGPVSEAAAAILDASMPPTAAVAALDPSLAVEESLGIKLRPAKEKKSGFEVMKWLVIGFLAFLATGAILLWFSGGKILDLLLGQHGR